MKKLFLFAFLSFAAYSQVQIQVVDPDVDPASFQGDGYKVETESKQFNAIPDKEKRDEFFKGVKLPPKWDQLDQDIFFMDLKSKKIEQLEQKYPEFGREKLKSLKAKRG